MIEQQGRVVRLVGNEVAVQVGHTSGCPACDAGSGCGAGIFTRLLRRKPVLLQVHNAIGAHPGQAVMLGLPEKTFLRLLLRLYLLPLLAALAGAAAGNLIAARLQATAGMADGISLFCASISFGLVLFLGRRHAAEWSQNLSAELLRKVPVMRTGAECQSNREFTEF